MRKLIALSLCLTVLMTNQAFSMEPDEGGDESHKNFLRTQVDTGNQSDKDRDNFDKFQKSVVAAQIHEETPTGCNVTRCFSYLNPGGWAPRSKALAVGLLGFGSIAALYLYDCAYGTTAHIPNGQPLPLMEMNAITFEDEVSYTQNVQQMCIPEINFNNITKYIATHCSDLVSDCVCRDPRLFLQEYLGASLEGRSDYLSQTAAFDGIMPMSLRDLKEFARGVAGLSKRIYDMPTFIQHKLVFDYIEQNKTHYMCHYTASFEECEWYKWLIEWLPNVQYTPADLTNMYNSLVCRPTPGSSPHDVTLIFKNGQPYKDLFDFVKEYGTITKLKYAGWR